MAGIKIERYPNNEIRFTKLPTWNGKRAPRDSGPLFFDEVEVIPTSDKQCDLPPLDITSEFETAPKPGYGAQPRPTEFGPFGRRKLIRAGAAMTKSIDSPNEVVFLTGTLPGSTIEAFRAIASYSSMAVHRLKAWVAKRCPAKLDMYCWEWQKRGALHLHYAVHVPVKESREYIISEFKNQWTRIIDAISEESGVDLWRKNEKITHANNKEVLQADARECTKDIGRYLSKYISKQSSKHKNKQFFPTRWWGISRPLNALLESLSEVITIPFTSEWRYRRVCRDLDHFVDTQEMTVQRYSVEQFADVCIAYTIPEEHGDIFECMKRIIRTYHKELLASRPGGTTPDWITQETEELVHSIRSLYAQLTSSPMYAIWLQDLLSQPERMELESIAALQCPTPRNALVIWSRLSCILEASGIPLRDMSPISNIRKRMDAKAGALLNAWPKNVPLLEVLGPPDEVWPPTCLKS